MTLDEHLKTAGLSNAKFGELVKASEATISRLRNGKQEPSMSLMKRIREATAGAVTPNDFTLSASTPEPAGALA